MTDEERKVWEELVRKLLLAGESPEKLREEDRYRRTELSRDCERVLHRALYNGRTPRVYKKKRWRERDPQKKRARILLQATVLVYQRAAVATEQRNALLVGLLRELRDYHASSSIDKMNRRVYYADLLRRIEEVIK